MTKGELRALNAELIVMLMAMRDQIDEKLDELDVIEEEEEDEDEEEDDTDEDEGEED